jgi:hypothetical protein
MTSADIANEMADSETPELDHEAAKLLASGLDSRPRATAKRSKADLHVCPGCDSELVYPIDWAPVAGSRWVVELRCPDCEWRASGTFSQAQVDRFDDVLDTGTACLLDELKFLTRANMKEQIERFVAAMHAGDILPEDF